MKSDVELWSLVGIGNEDAFGHLFDRYARTIYNYAFRRTSDWSTAEEVVAMTFMQAWRRRDTVVLRGDSARPWLLGVATNVMRNISRSRRRHLSAIQRLAGTRADEPWPEEETVERVAAIRASRSLSAALDDLPKRHREVVWLCLIEEMSYAEASEALGVPVGTVRSRLSRARERLRNDERLELLWARGHNISEDDEPPR